MDDTPRTQGKLATSLLGVLALAAVGLGYHFLRAPPAPPQPAPQPVPAPGPVDAAEVIEPPDAGPQVTELEITDVSGRVEVRRGGGQFEPARAGTVLRVDDAVRTAEGRARLTAKGAYDVQVEPGTDLEVHELTSQMSRLQLGAGMLVAKVEGGGGHQLEVKAAQSDAVASTRDGTFAMSNNGAGTVAVGSRAGEVDFQAGGKAVLLRAGQQSISHGGAPSAPAPIPSSLFLKVDWPERREMNRAQVQLSGRTAPGSIVVVEGERVQVQSDGRFSAGVRLREGRNTIRAESLDVGGHQAEGRAELTVHTKAPDSEIKTKGLWK